MSARDVMAGSDIFEQLFLALPSVRAHHAPTDRVYRLLKQVARREAEGLFSGLEPVPRSFKPFGELILPYHRMGLNDAFSSLNLFDLDELILFSFYWINRHRYRRVLDIGANIGLHAVLLSRCGYAVRAYEPDAEHVELLQKHLLLNRCSDVEVFHMAVSNEAGVREFVRVLGNTLGSHLAGSKANPYGALERMPVQVEAIGSIIEWADLIKLDAEGHERDILLTTQRAHWLTRDALVEVGTAENASSLYDHFGQIDVHLFAQKINWERVRRLADMPTNYHEGTLFVSRKSVMPWEATE